MSQGEGAGPITEPRSVPLPPALAHQASLQVRALPSLKGRMLTAITRAGPLLTYRLNRLGAAGAGGAALLLAGVVFFFSAILPQQRDLANLEQELRDAHRRGKVEESAPVRLTRFMTQLPARSQLPVIAGQVFSKAAAAGLTLERGRYEIIPLRSGHLAQYRMTFPVKGQYPAIRKFIDSVLATVPAAGIEGLRIERKGVAEDNVSADLRFSVFVRNDS